MKHPFCIIICLLLIHIESSAQKINNSNYYNYVSSQNATTNWLRISDAVPVIIDELKKNGVSYHTIGIGDLLKINDTSSLVVSVSFTYNDSSYGFVYERNHSASLNVKERDYLKNTGNQKYYQIQKDTSVKGYKWILINPLPHNIFLLCQTTYWYQYDDNNTKFPVDRTMIEEILRQDIRDYLKRL